MTYSMTETSTLTGISASAIRFYEKEGLMPSVARKASGVRIFSDADVERLTFIKELKAAGLSIAEIRACFHFCDQGDATIDRRIALFQAHRQDVQNKIEVLAHCLEHIDEKISYLEQKKMGHQ